jgi:hypothetical protein
MVSTDIRVRLFHRQGRLGANLSPFPVFDSVLNDVTNCEMGRFNTQSAGASPVAFPHPTLACKQHLRIQDRICARCLPSVVFWPWRNLYVDTPMYRCHVLPADYPNIPVICIRVRPIFWSGNVVPTLSTYLRSLLYVHLLSVASTACTDCVHLRNGHTAKLCAVTFQPFCAVYWNVATLFVQP